MKELQNSDCDSLCILRQPSTRTVSESAIRYVGPPPNGAILDADFEHNKRRLGAVLASTLLI